MVEGSDSERQPNACQEEVKVKLSNDEIVSQLPVYTDTNEPFIPNRHKCWTCGVKEKGGDPPHSSSPEWDGHSEEWYMSPLEVHMWDGNFYSTKSSADKAFNNQG